MQPKNQLPDDAYKYRSILSPSITTVHKASFSNSSNSSKGTHLDNDVLQRSDKPVVDLFQMGNAHSDSPSIYAWDVLISKPSKIKRKFQHNLHPAVGERRASPSYLALAQNDHLSPSLEVLSKKPRSLSLMCNEDGSSQKHNILRSRSQFKKGDSFPILNAPVPIHRGLGPEPLDNQFKSPEMINSVLSNDMKQGVSGNCSSYNDTRLQRPLQAMRIKATPSPSPPIITQPGSPNLKRELLSFRDLSELVKITINNQQETVRTSSISNQRSTSLLNQSSTTIARQLSNRYSKSVTNPSLDLQTIARKVPSERLSQNAYEPGPSPLYIPYTISQDTTAEAESQQKAKLLAIENREICIKSKEIQPNLLATRSSQASFLEPSQIRSRSSSDGNNALQVPQNLNDSSTGGSSPASSVRDPMSPASGHTPSFLSCPTCGGVFTGDYRKGNLARHIRTQHGGGNNNPRTFKCESAGCSKSFRRKDARLKHMRKHHSEMMIGAHVLPRNASST